MHDLRPNLYQICTYYTPFIHILLKVQKFQKQKNQYKLLNFLKKWKLWNYRIIK